MSKSTFIFIAIIICALLSIGVAWLLPIPSFAESPDDFRIAFGLANFSNVLSVGTALLFLAGLSGFKRELKTAYYLICVGLFVQVVSTMIYSVLSFVQTVERNLWGDLPITLGAALIFLGILRLAHALGVRSIFMHPLFIAAYLIVVSAVLWLVPHGSYGLDSYLVQANHVLEASFYPLAAILVWKAARVASATYRYSFLWLYAALFGNFVAAALFVGAAYLAYPAWLSIELMGSLFILDTIVYLIAGYTFSGLQQRLLQRQKVSTTLDIVAFVASLASRPADIDLILDRLRALTASLPSSRSITPEGEQELAAIYLQLEDYLTTKEPLRSLTRDSIRQLVYRKFERLPVGVSLSAK